MLHCELGDGTVGAVPAWMTDAASCGELSAGEPRASLEALVELRGFLDALKEAAGRLKRDPQSEEISNESKASRDDAAQPDVDRAERKPGDLAGGARRRKASPAEGAGRPAVEHSPSQRRNR